MSPIFFSDFKVTLNKVYLSLATYSGYSLLQKIEPQICYRHSILRIIKIEMECWQRTEKYVTLICNWEPNVILR